MRRAALFLATVLAAAAAPLTGQDAILPREPYVRPFVADPHAPRFGAGLLRTNLLATQGPERPDFFIPDPEDSRSDVVAAVALGGLLPLLQVADWRGGGAMLYADARVFSRFRIEYAGRDDMGQDWYVGGGVMAREREWSGSLALIHRSSHLGDEFHLVTNAERIEFGSEQLDLRSAIDVADGVRVYGGGTWIFRSYLGWDPLLAPLQLKDRVLVQLGADGERRLGADPRVRVFGGIDMQAAERTDWDPGLAAAIGIGVRTHRSFRLMLRAYDGPSMMGEFFLTPETYFALEIVAEF